MEEHVGVVWHRLVTKVASQEFPDASVRLDDSLGELGVLYRALGGDPGRRITPAQPTDYASHRNLSQRLAGTGKKAELGWQDAKALRLPGHIAAFPTAELNFQCYLWLVALAPHWAIRRDHWLQDASRAVKAALHAIPGLRPIYQRLVKQLLKQRPKHDHLPADYRDCELAVRAALADPEYAGSVHADCAVLPLPVPVWLHLDPPPCDESSSPRAPDEAGSPNAPNADTREQTDSEQHHQGERVDEPDEKSGLLAFRLESLFSWSEYVKVDRTADEAESDDALRAARDMDRISVSRGKTGSKTRLKLDLDLPPEADDETLLTGKVLLPEWDWKRKTLVDDHVCVKELCPSDREGGELPEHLWSVARRLRAQFEALRPHRVRVNRQVDGEDIDLDAWLAWQVDRRRHQAGADQALYTSQQSIRRSLSCLLLVDLSMSTDAHLDDEHRVIDVIRDSAVLFHESLTACGDRHAINGFSSRRRDHVQIHQLKGFSPACVRDRLQSMQPGYYTRMGAAIRHASKALSEEKSEQRLLLILSDGKPNDLDRYEGRYGIEDTRQAVREARDSGLTTFCVTVDKAANAYLPYLFGPNGYAMVRHAADLPIRLPQLYLELTNGG